MNQTRRPIVGPCHFQWNAGGWFGSQLGGTAWLLVGAIYLFYRSIPISLTWVLCFGLANVLGCSIWARRTVVAPFKGIQLLMLVLTLAGFVSWFTLTWFRHDLVSEIHAKTHMGYLALLIFPIMMTWFYCLERGTAKQTSSGS